MAGKATDQYRLYTIGNLQKFFQEFCFDGVEEIVESHIKVLLPDPGVKHQVLGIKLAFGKCLREIA